MMLSTTAELAIAALETRLDQRILVYLALFFTTCVLSTIGYAIPVFYNALPQYLINELVSIKKRAIPIIILPESSYSDT